MAPPGRRPRLLSVGLAAVQGAAAFHKSRVASPGLEATSCRRGKVPS